MSQGELTRGTWKELEFVFGRGPSAPWTPDDGGAAPTTPAGGGPPDPPAAYFFHLAFYSNT